MLWGGVKAQTDVTSTYITNPDFESESGVFLQLNTSRLIYKPIGWSVQWDQSGKGRNGNSAIAESWNQDSNNWTAKEGKSFFVRHAWEGNTFYLRQTMVSLRPGAYTLSFAMAANRAHDSNTLTLKVAGEEKDISPSTNSNASGNWSDISIDFTITASTPNATIEIKADHTANGSTNAYLKYALDNFKLMYDGSSYYTTILSKAQALYDDNKDWAEDADDLSTAITAATGKSSVDDKNAAIFALESAMQTFKETNSRDVTSLITNPTFDSNISGWTTTGGDGNGFQRQGTNYTNLTGGFLEKWRDASNGKNNQKNFDVYQELSSLPAGEYTIKAAIQGVMQGSKGVFDDNTSGYTNRMHGGPFYISDDKGVWMYGVSGENESKAWANSDNSTFVGTGGGVYRTVSVQVSNGSLKLGFRGVGSPNGGSELGTYANWIACDNWSLSYFGFDPTTLNATIVTLKENAAALLENDEYDNVVGTERTALTTASTLVPADEKKNTLETAISQIEDAISDFTSAKTNYDALVAEIARAKALGMATATADSYAATSSSTATSVLTNIQNVKAAEFTFITTDKALVADITLLMTNPSFENGADAWNSDWTTSRNTTGTFDYKYVATSGETADDGLLDGTNALNAWAPQINYINVTQTVNLPAGHYRLTASVFSDKIKNQHIAAKAGGKTYNSAVLNGAIWQTLSVDFNVPEEGNVTLGIYSNGNNVNGDSYGWFKADNFKLYYLGDAAANMKIAAGKYGTFIAPFDVTIPDGVTASKVTGVSDNELVLEDVATTIPANTPVVVTSTSAVDETFYERSTASEDSYKEGLLTGVYTAATIAASTESEKNYVLQTQNEKQAFYLVDSEFTATANRAYLTLNTANAPKHLEFGNHSSAINDIAIEEAMGNGTIYNVAGQRMQTLQKGINIVNGKKILVK